MKNVKFLLLSCMTLLMMLSSCSSRKNFVYLQDMVPGERYPYESRQEAVVHRNDRLDITVSCKRPELAIPFNTHSNSFSVGADGAVSTASGESATKGYRVDVDGCIDFPILGKIYVEGLSVSDVTNLIERKIVEGNYIKDPIVSLEFLNFRYTVLGAVGNVGTYTVKDDRVNLFEAIAQAGDLTDKAMIDKVAVIREINGEREILYHDLRSKDIFTSPCFCLQQNDIVYVEPKYRKKDAEDRGFQITTVLLSLASVIVSAIWALGN